MKKKQLLMIGMLGLSTLALYFHSSLCGLGAFVLFCYLVD